MGKVESEAKNRKREDLLLLLGPVARVPSLAVDIAILFPELTSTSLLNAFELVNPTAMEGPETGQCLRGHVITMQ